MEDAVARARAIAAKLAGVPPIESRKRKLDNDDNSKAFKEKIYVPIKERPDFNFMGLIIGPRGSNIRTMEQNSGCKIYVRGRGTDVDQDDDLYVLIESDNTDSLELGKNAVNDLLFNEAGANQIKMNQLRNLAEIKGDVVYDNDGSRPSTYGGAVNDTQNNASIDIRIPNNMVGLIIGSKGDTLKKLQNTTGGRLKIDTEAEMQPGDTERRIKVMGADMEVVNNLKNKVEDMIREREAASNTSNDDKVSAATKQQPQLDHPFVIRLPVPNEKVGLIIGRQGQTIKLIQERSKSLLQIPTGPDEDNPQVRTISIGAYSREDAEAGKKEVASVLQSYAMQQQGGAMTTGTYVCPNDKVGLIIGKGGRTLKDLVHRTGAKLQIPAEPDAGSNPPVRTIVIVGDEHRVNNMRAEIDSIISAFTQGQPYGHARQGQGNHYGAHGGYGQQGYGQGGQYGSYGGVGGAAFGNYGAGAGTNANAYGNYGANIVAPVAAVQAQPQAQAQQQEVSTDPAYWRGEFWRYASYYGEAAARQFYGAWAPPEGTAPPEGITLPATGGAGAGAGAGEEDGQKKGEDGTEAGAEARSSSKDADDTQESEVNKDSEFAATTDNTTTEEIETEPASKRKKEEETADTDADAGHDTTTTTDAGGTGLEENGDGRTEEEIEAWNKYLSDYREWWLQYGKELGAPEDPSAT